MKALPCQTSGIMNFRFICVLGLFLVPFTSSAQPVLQQPDFFRPREVNSLRNLRVVSQNSDKTETVLAMDYSYDGMWGGSVLLLPVIEKRSKQGVSAWFGADPVPLTAGQGLISVKVRYFNDEPGVPPQLETDRIRMLYLNSSGVAVVSSSMFLKTIKWGSPNAKTMVLKVPPPAQMVISAGPKPTVIEPSTPSAEEIRIEQQRREEARMVAEQKARKLAEEKRLAEEKARLEAEARAEARRRAQAEQMARIESEAKARAQAEAKEKERRQAEAEAQRLAEEKRQMEAKALREAQAQELERLKAEIRAQEEARIKAEREVQRLIEEKQQADERARAEAKAREEARLKMEAEERERINAEARAQAEAAAREKERIQAEAELKRLAEEKLQAEQKLRAEEKARQQAAEAAKAQAQPKVPPAKRDAQVSIPTRTAKAPVMTEESSSNLKTKITNVDVVNRSLDRSQMTIGVEFEYRDQLGKPILGVDVVRSGDPESKQFFSSTPAEIGRSRRNFVLVPVKFQPPPDQGHNYSPFSTDRLLVYLAEGATSRRFNLFNATMLLIWNAPGTTPLATAAPSKSGNSLEMDDFKQNDLFSGYVTVRYQLNNGPGQIRMRLFDSANPSSAKYFNTQEYRVQAGRNLQLLEFAVSPAAKSASDVIKADTIEIELLDASGQVVARLAKKTPMTWARPK